MNRRYFMSGLLCLSLALPAAATAESVIVESGHRSPPDFSGTWLLDKASSDDPEAKMKEAREMMRESRGMRGGMGGSFGRGKGGGMSDGRQDSGRGSPRGMLATSTSELRALINGAKVLELSHADPMLLITADGGPQQRLFTDFRGATVSASTAQQAVMIAGWEGDVLVVEITRDGSPRMMQRYQLDAGSDQLEVRTVFTPPGSSGHLLIKCVYGRANAQATRDLES